MGMAFWVLIALGVGLQLCNSKLAALVVSEVESLGKASGFVITLLSGSVFIVGL